MLIIVQFPNFLYSALLGKIFEIATAYYYYYTPTTFINTEPFCGCFPRNFL